MQVFISYAHTPADSKLAEHVADRLRKVGLTPWLDSASMYSGQVLQDTIARAVATSSHGVFLVSQSWIEREWTAFELDEFAKRDPAEVRRTPIFRAPRQTLTVPPALVKWLGFEWDDGDPDYDARFWQLLCAIRGVPPGPLETWSDEGRKAAPLARPAGIDPPPPPAFRPSLRCNRALQWTTLDSLAIDPMSDLVLVTGVAGQGHEHFVERIHQMLRTDPRRSIVLVKWPSRPQTAEEFFAYLAGALDVPRSALSQALADRLAYTNVVLLHPCVRAMFLDDPVVKYYTEWLPALVRDHAAPMHLKCVQPIEWPDEGAIDRVLGWLRLRPPAIPDGRPQAERLIHLVSTSAARALRVVRLHDFEGITDDDLKQFCRLVNLDERQGAWLLARIAERRPQHAADVFTAIDDYLPSARSLS